MISNIIYFQAFVIGTCLGSFLNVVIYRFPNDLSILRPRSFCPKCKTQLTWRENIPFIVVMRAAPSLVAASAYNSDSGNFVTFTQGDYSTTTNGCQLRHATTNQITVSGTDGSTNPKQLQASQWKPLAYTASANEISALTEAKTAYGIIGIKVSISNGQFDKKRKNK